MALYSTTTGNAPTDWGRMLARSARQAAPPLFWTGLALLAVSLPTLGLALLDERLFQGVSVWLKPWKFQVSVGVFLLTLALFMGWLPRAALRSRAAKYVVWGAVCSGLFEVAYISVQGAQGLASHFNTATRLSALLYQLMGLGAVTLSSTALVLGLLVARSKGYALAGTLKLSIVLGLVLTFLLGTGFGAYLSAQLNGHWVGGSLSDAGGLPLVKWSRDGGDLRVAHFFASMPCISYRPSVWQCIGCAWPTALNGWPCGCLRRRLPPSAPGPSARRWRAGP